MKIYTMFKKTMEICNKSVVQPPFLKDNIFTFVDPSLSSLAIRAHQGGWGNFHTVV